MLTVLLIMTTGTLTMCEPCHLLLTTVNATRHKVFIIGCLEGCIPLVVRPTPIQAS